MKTFEVLIWTDSVNSVRKTVTAAELETLRALYRVDVLEGEEEPQDEPKTKKKVK